MAEKLISSGYEYDDDDWDDMDEGSVYNPCIINIYTATDGAEFYSRDEAIEYEAKWLQEEYNKGV